MRNSTEIPISTVNRFPSVSQFCPVGPRQASRDRCSYSAPIPAASMSRGLRFPVLRA
jgi:hypothetical protein